MPTKTFETKLNAFLSNLLNEKLCFRSVAETKIGEGRADILIFVGGIKIIIEGSYSQTDAEQDVSKRIEKGFGDIGIALHYKEEIPDKTESEVIEILKNSKFNAKIFSPKDISETLIRYIENKTLMSISETQWFEVDVLGLVDLIENAYEFFIKEEFVIKTIQEIEQSCIDFVNGMENTDRQKIIAEKLYNTLYKLYGLHVGDYKQISELIYAKAFLTILLSTAFYHSVQPYLKKPNGEALKSLNFLVSNGNKEGLMEAFKDISFIDYHPIYELSLQVLDNLPSVFLKDVIRLGIKLGSNQTLLRRDFSGKIYHKIVGDWSIRKGFSTFFTTIPSAYLLSHLSVFSEFEKFENAENIKVCDFTCGSGTLLTACYSSLEDLYKFEKFEEEINLENFHRKMLEENLWGFDALRYASQIASLNLVFHNPSIALKNMNFYTTPLGIDEKGNVVLGSLIYLKRGTLVHYFILNSKPKRTSAIDTETENESIPKFDFIIMNPPYTRATGRGGKEHGGLFGFIVDEKSRKMVMKEYEILREDIKKYLENIGKDYLKKFEEGTFSGIGQAGEGLLFLYLAFQYLNRNGRIAFVLPKTFLSGASWFLIRTLLLEKFHLEYVVVSYDKKKGYNFSESTNLSECLIIAKKMENHDDKKSRFIMLLNKPKTSFEAKALARAIINNGNFVQGDSATAFIHTVSKNDLKENVDNWGRFVAFPNIKLLKFIDKLNEGKLFEKNISMVRLGEIATIGIDRHQFNDMFKITDRKVPGSYPVVYSGKEKERTYMKGEFNAFGNPKNEKADEIFKEKASRLLVSNRMRLTTAHIISILLSSKTLSNLFYGVKLKREGEKKYKALCSWLNSTFGLLLILTNRQETEGAWISLGLSHWRLQNVLNINKLNKKTIEKLSDVFDKYCEKKMDRLPRQYNPKNIDEIRFAYDKEVLSALNIKISDDNLKDLYTMVYESFEQWF